MKTRNKFIHIIYKSIHVAHLFAQEIILSSFGPLPSLGLYIEEAPTLKVVPDYVKCSEYKESSLANT